MKRKRLLVFEGGPEAKWQSRKSLNPELYDVEFIGSRDLALQRIQRQPVPDAVVLTIQRGGSDMDCVALFRQAGPSSKIITLLPENQADLVVKAVRMGADACLWNSDDQQALLHGALEECLTGSFESSSRLETVGGVEELNGGGFFVMASPAMRKLRAQVGQVAKIDVPVFILGESGTGKEVIAKLVHNLSPRALRPFLKVNCAAIPAELLESELFGHERGAFTGAVRSKPGKFEACNHGTLFLDEIAEMPPALQAKLLHVLQDQEFSRLGSCSRLKVNVRVLAATNVNIKEAIATKTFREDLYYRISTFVFSIPPLRDRRDDIPVLLSRYLKHHADRLHLPARKISNELWERCLSYDWPGNVRELENFTKRYLICGEDETAVPPASHGPKNGFQQGLAGEADSAPGDFKFHMREVRNTAEASAISLALEQTNWNRKQAAKRLTISYKSLLSKIRQYRLDQTYQKPLTEYNLKEEIFNYVPLRAGSSD